ncbi:succinylglutamate-semialdehyde dehydrogenase [Neptuniibacter sp. CAU 1671]|uniref:succinylglutamate-semialdehyde dehydrogenase n=1 Tax=Neptuniibacter sp. CAU 1671 TaxID=3032593 RepID=UPI0023DCB99A|nr:succinylglutamate-semialdehyde dehydrogenase [Neptuniibacter sp. CAU 1671]MDF2182533.1 succinylglutamate-semialdehyde dehydrogenase [Neptuniibacter sp. CAU 1671]
MKPASSLFINGTWVTGHGPDMISVNPATDQAIWHGHEADSHQIEQAFQAAANAFPTWSALPIPSRSRYLELFAKHLAEEKEHIADTIGQETGKPLWEARTEVDAMLGKLPLTLKAYAQRCPDEITETDSIKSVLSHKPHGIVAVFGPYNFPGHLPNGHIMPALLAGNTLIFKPSELTPRTAELLVCLWQKANLPAGVLNLLQGGSTVGAEVARHPDLNGIYFTGSARTGTYLHQQFGGHPEKILALEMGGNNPLLVTEVANLDAAVVTTLQSAYLSAGQRCSCARRLLVPEGPTGDAFIDRLIAGINHLTYGAYDDAPQPFMGCLINQEAANQMLEAQKKLAEAGASMLVEMQSRNATGTLLSPGLIDCTALNQVEDEEYFGPLLQLYRIRDFDHGITLANQTRYGLSAGILTDNPALFKQFHHHVRAGVINWNRPLTGAASARPFGGIGISGNHRPSAWYAADYCAYPVASLQSETLTIPNQLPPGLSLPKE